MTKVAIWCRHTGDNVIGIGNSFPWHIASDLAKFRRITEGQYVVAGRKTYESFPGRTLPERKIIVLTFSPNYEVSDPQNHFVCTECKELAEFKHDLYIAGGAQIYELFLTDGNTLKPEIVVDCEYKGELEVMTGDKTEISKCVEILHKDYRKISRDYEQDNVVTAIWVRKGCFVEQSVLKRLVGAIEIDFN